MSNKKQYRYILVIEDGKKQWTVTLDKSKYSIGRHSSNSIIVDSKQVSRFHATLLRKKTEDCQSFWIRDGDLEGNRSHNGIFINGEKKIEYKLNHGDIIYFGREVKGIYQIFEDNYNISFYPNNNIPSKKNDINPLQEQLENILFASEQNLQQKLNNLDVYMLASFTELNPNPIIEIDCQGIITYINPAGALKFNNIKDLKLEHPILQGLIHNYQNQNQQKKLLKREVTVGEAIFEQYIYHICPKKSIITYLFDITERKKSEARLEYQVNHDDLTNLPNRNFFTKYLSQAVINAKNQDYLLVVMFLDIDRFKNINNSLGHEIGDKLIQDFAQRLKNSLSSSDLIARWGGDEFTILIPEINNLQEITKISEKILKTFKHPFQINGQELYLSASIGIAIYPRDGESAETLIKNADVALYRTKKEGRNNFQFYNPSMNFQASLLLKIENLLHYALEKDEFVLYYQPQMNLKNNKIYGLEALLRWNNPELGMIPPDKFIPIAEETGLIVPIGEWVLKTACQQNKTWQDKGLPPLRIGVNLSPRQFQEPELVSQIVKILNETGLDPNFLELEITETTVMQNPKLASQYLESLLKIGVHISMDDFGTGYSSLGYLKNFPLHTIKIDKTFIKELKNNPKDLAIISAVITLGRGFNMRVIAEGVETPEQLELLRHLQCEEIQGYLLSHPLTSEEVEKFLQNPPYHYF